MSAPPQTRFSTNGIDKARGGIVNGRACGSRRDGRIRNVRNYSLFWKAQM
jgi:hypothetical protein